MIGKISLSSAVSAIGRPCNGRRAMEPGLDWNRWLGPAAMRPYSSVLSPRGCTAMGGLAGVPRVQQRHGLRLGHHLDIALGGSDGMTAARWKSFRRNQNARRGACTVMTTAYGCITRTASAWTSLAPKAVFRSIAQFNFTRGERRSPLYSARTAARSNQIDDGRTRYTQGRQGCNCTGFWKITLPTSSRRSERGKTITEGVGALGDLLPFGEPGLLPQAVDQVESGRLHLCRRVGRPGVAQRQPTRLPRLSDCLSNAPKANKPGQGLDDYG